MNRKFGSWESLALGGRYGPFFAWSPLVSASGSVLYTRYVDKLTKGIWRDSWRNKRNCWNRRVLLRPQGEPDTRFVVGFVAFFGDSYLCQINSKHERRVSQGPFAMLLGPMPCCFFTLSANQPVAITIEDVCEGELSPRQWQNLDLY